MREPLARKHHRQQALVRLVRRALLGRVRRELPVVQLLEVGWAEQSQIATIQISILAARDRL